MKYPDLLSKICKNDDKLLIGTSALGLYAFLIYRWYGNKCQDFILSDVVTSEKLNLSINTLRVLKKKLESHNLIEFEVRSGLPCCYKIVTEQFTLKNKKDVKENVELKKVNSYKSKNKRKDSLNHTATASSIDEEIKPLDVIKNPNIPSFDEFLAHAKSLKNYISEADHKIEKKYNFWLKKGWNNDYNRPIIDWKSLLKSMLQYIIDSNENEDKTLKIPNIKPPNTK